MKLTRYLMLAALTLLIAGWTSSNVMAQVELLGYWKLDETNVDEPALDSSGRDIHGEFEGDIELGQPGVVGTSAYFDGFTAAVNVGAGDENGLGELINGFSVMAWIQPDQFDSKNRILGSAPWEAGAGWGFGTVRDELEMTTYGVRDFDQPVPLEIDEWAHVAVVLDTADAAHFYHNGEFVGTQEHGSSGGPTINDFFIGYAAVAAEYFSGFIDEVAVFDGELTDEQIMVGMTEGPACILGGDGCDIGGDPFAPLDDGTLTETAERTAYIHDTLGTWVGDVNLDLEFNSTDFVVVFTAGEYEDGIAGNSTYASGDWNGDKEFDSSDFVTAFTDGGFEQGPRMAAAVPEPSGVFLLLIGGSLLLARRK